MIRANDDIRKEAKNAGVLLWQVAESIGITDNSFSRKLRHELSQSEKDIIFKAIEDLKRGDMRDVS